MEVHSWKAIIAHPRSLRSHDDRLATYLYEVMLYWAKQLRCSTSRKKLVEFILHREVLARDAWRSIASLLSVSRNCLQCDSNEWRRAIFKTNNFHTASVPHSHISKREKGFFLYLCAGHMVRIRHFQLVSVISSHLNQPSWKTSGWVSYLQNTLQVCSVDLTSWSVHLSRLVLCVEQPLVVGWLAP